MKISVAKIISGGQTGADRAALDFAIKHHIPHGGWVPKGRKAEDGPILKNYHLWEMPTGKYSDRTERNVFDSDGTLIISHGNLTEGSALTASFADQHHKHCIHIDLEQWSLQDATVMICSWLGNYKIGVLNVAGPRASKDPEIYSETLKLLGAVFEQG